MGLIHCCVFQDLNNIPTFYQGADVGSPWESDDSPEAEISVVASVQQRAQPYGRTAVGIWLARRSKI